MNKIIQLIQHPKIGGLEKMAYSLCQKNINEDKMYMVSLEGRKQESYKEWPELIHLENFYCLNKKNKFDWNVVNKLVKLVDEKKINIIHSHHIGPLIYATLLKIKRPKIKHIHTVHDAWYLSNKKYNLFTKIIKKTTNVTIVSDAKSVSNMLEEQTKIKSDYIVLNGIDTNYFSPTSKLKSRKSLKLPTEKILIGCAARIEKGKGQKYLIDSLLNLPKKIEIVFAGEGSEKRKLEEYAKKINVSDRVHWLGNVHNMPTFYSSIDIFSLFSEKEGLPLSIMEAMSCNKPVVVSDVGGIKEVVNQETGIVVSFENKDKLYKYLLLALKFNYGLNIRKKSLNIINIREMQNKYHLIYDRLKK